MVSLVLSGPSPVRLRRQRVATRPGTVLRTKAGKVRSVSSSSSSSSSSSEINVLAEAAAASCEIDTRERQRARSTAIRRENLMNVKEALRGGVFEKDAGETEFLQAVDESLSSLAPLLVENDSYIDILKRLLEPERTISFRVPWTDDKGEAKCMLFHIRIISFFLNLFLLFLLLLLLLLFIIRT